MWINCKVEFALGMALSMIFSFLAWAFSGPFAAMIVAGGAWGLGVVWASGIGEIEHAKLKGESHE